MTSIREILFRGKAINRDPNRVYRTDYKNGDWVFGLPTKLERDFNIAEMRNEVGVSGIDVDIETVGQFSGLTDRKSKKIFEGDIVKAVINLAGELCYAIGVVIFENGTFKLKVFQSKNTAEYKQYTGANVAAYSLEHNFIERRYLLEVIGNIFDNPDLLVER